MIRYFLHIKFWMPIVVLIILALFLEVILRMGFWDKLVKPRSYLGNAVYRDKAIREFGLDNIHWITIGNSRIDWGLDHEKLLKFQKTKNLNHLRIWFESSNFISIQATIDWSIKNMPHLKGIILALSEDDFAKPNNIKKQYKVNWPFRFQIDYNNFTYFQSIMKLYSYIYRTAVFVYFDDIRDFFQNIPLRIKKINKYMLKQHKNIFHYHYDLIQNLCDYPLDSLKQCIETANNILNTKIKKNNTEKFILNQCNNDFARMRFDRNLPYPESPQNTKSMYIKNWSILLHGILEHRIKLKLVLLPESAIINYTVKPSNTNEIVTAITTKINNDEFFYLLDLRNEFSQKDGIHHCEFYNDPIHYNIIGRSIITQKIIESFHTKKTLKHKQKPDLIIKHIFYQ